MINEIMFSKRTMQCIALKTCRCAWRETGHGEQQDLMLRSHCHAVALL